MSTLDRVPGAGLLVDGEFTITDGNERCQVVFKEPFDSIRGADLETLAGRGLFDEQTRDKWERAITATLDGSSEEVTEQITLTPAGSDEEYVYDLRVTPHDGDREVVCCSLRSVGTSRRYDETITALHVATRKLMTATNIETVLQRTAVAASDVLGFPGTAVREYDTDEGVLRHVAFGARVENIDSRPPYPIEGTPHGEALLAGETVIETIDEDDDPYDRGIFTQTMYIPIGAVGLLSVGTVGNTFDETDVQFAEILAENAAAAIRVVDTTTTLRQERERLELLRQILTRVLRHNIRNDMNVIKGHAEILGTKLGEENQEFVANILASVENVTSLSEKAREIERIIEKPHSRRRIDLEGAVEKAIRRVGQEYSDVSVRTDLAGACPVYAHSSLDVALTNLLENAHEHAGESGSPARISVTRHEGTVEISVADDGPGIPDHEIEVLAAGSESDLEHGSGLGLWIVNWVVDRSEGTLEFDTTDGTTVRMTLSRAREDGE